MSRLTVSTSLLAGLVVLSATAGPGRARVLDTGNVFKLGTIYYPDDSWEILGDLDIRSGSLSITDGSSVSNYNAFVGHTIHSHGAPRATGRGGRWAPDRAVGGMAYERSRGRRSER